MHIWRPQQSLCVLLGRAGGGEEAAFLINETLKPNSPCSIIVVMSLLYLEID